MAQCLFGQFRPLSKLPHKERQVHYFWLSVYKYASSRAQHKTNTLNSVVTQNDIRPCCQKECFDCFDVPELSPLFSCVVILGKKEMTSMEMEDWKGGEWWRNEMECEYHKNKSGHNYFL